MTLIIGIDPGLKNTGWGVIQVKDRVIKLIASGVVITDSKDEEVNRLVKICTALQKLIVEYTVASGAIENTYVNNNFGSSLKLAQARAASLLALGLKQIEVEQYPATMIKKTITGSGAADKQQVQKMLRLILNNANSTKFDESDAISIAVCHALKKYTTAN